MMNPRTIPAAPSGAPVFHCRQSLSHLPVKLLLPLFLVLSAIMSADSALAGSRRTVSEPGALMADSATGANDCRPASLSIDDRLIRGGLLYDVAADAVIWEKNAHQPLPIASLTKMMVALIAMEDITAGRVRLDDKVRVTAQAAAMKGSKINLKTGCHVTVEELLKAAMIASGNDAAYLLAQHLGGGESSFVRRMNKRARQLGMTDTRYANPTGMPERDSRNDNRSSPTDLLTLALEMLQYDFLVEISGMPNAIITQDERPIHLRNHNALVSIYEDVDGFKTGFTNNAKYCLVATANKEGRRLVSIVLGAPGRNLRNDFSATLINRYYNALGLGELTPKTGFALASCPPKKFIAEKIIGRPAPAKHTGPSLTVRSPRYHRVAKGETLFAIARNHGCTVSDLKTWNNLHSANRIEYGRKLVIRDGGVQAKIAPEKTNKGRKLLASNKTSKKAVKGSKSANARKKADSRVVRTYKIRRGDTLYEIAKKFDGVSVNAIMKTNRIKNARDLKPGKTIKIVLDA